MGEDLLQKPTTPSVHLNDENVEDTNVEVEDNENLMYVVLLSDIHFEHYEINLNDLYIDAKDIIVVYIIKENFEEGTDFKEMLRSTFGNDMAFLNPNTFV
jgi:hypothetical protein